MATLGLKLHLITTFENWASSTNISNIKTWFILDIKKYSKQCFHERQLITCDTYTILNDQFTTITRAWRICLTTATSLKKNILSFIINLIQNFTHKREYWKNTHSVTFCNPIHRRILWTPAFILQNPILTVTLVAPIKS